MTSQILKFVDFTKTQKSRHLENETFFLQIKNSVITHQGYFMTKITFVVEVTCKEFSCDVKGFHHMNCGLLYKRLWRSPGTR